MQSDATPDSRGFKFKFNYYGFRPELYARDPAAKPVNHRIHNLLLREFFPLVVQPREEPEGRLQSQQARRRRSFTALLRTRLATIYRVLYENGHFLRCPFVLI